MIGRHQVNKLETEVASQKASWKLVQTELIQRTEELTAERLKYHLVQQSLEEAQCQARANRATLDSLTHVTRKLEEQLVVSRNLFEEVIGSRLRQVAAGTLLASRLGITIDRSAGVDSPFRYIITLAGGLRCQYVRHQFEAHAKVTPHTVLFPVASGLRMPRFF